MAFRSWRRSNRAKKLDWDKVREDVVQAKGERAAKLKGQEDIVEAVEALLFERDPIGINFEENTDEYRPEAETIVIRLRDAASDQDAARIVYEEFVRWFDPTTAGSPDKYRPIAAEVGALDRPMGWRIGAVSGRLAEDGVVVGP